MGGSRGSGGGAISARPPSSRRASLRAALRMRFSRTEFSRFIFAIVVRFLELEAMGIPSVRWGNPGADDRRPVTGPAVKLRGTRCRLERLDVRGVGALGADLSLVADLRALGERLEAVAGDARVVHEQVLALIVGRDEAEALVVAEPLHGSGCHFVFPPGRSVRAKRGRCEEQLLRDAGTTLPGTVARPADGQCSPRERQATTARNWRTARGSPARSGSPSRESARRNAARRRVAASRV